MLSTVVRYAKARPKPGVMNKTEAAYALHLEKLKRIGDILDYGFEKYKLKLADKTYYTPDFYVIEADGTLSFREVKGFWQDDARVKIKVAAAQFPHRFIAVTKKKQLWETEEF